MPEKNWNYRVRMYHFFVCVLFFISQQDASWSRDIRRAQKKTDFGTGVMVGNGILKYHHTCILFQVFFISDDFFSSLKQIETPAGTVFEKHRTQYVSFPDHLTVDVQATVHDCLPTLVEPFNYGASLIEKASFEVNWQSGSAERRAANLISTKMIHRQGSRWDYFLELGTTNVRLADNLNIDVSLREGLDHAYLHAGLVASAGATGDR